MGVWVGGQGGESKASVTAGNQEVRKMCVCELCVWVCLQAVTRDVADPTNLSFLQFS